MAELFCEPAMAPYFAEPRGPGWYVADAAGHDVLRVAFTTKRAAVRAIRSLCRLRVEETVRWCTPVYTTVLQLCHE